MTTIFLSLGSNQGDSCKTLLSVFDCIKSWEGTLSHQMSSLYQTEPWGLSSQPDFINSVVSFDTNLSVDDLFAQTKDLESQFGRQREKETRWGPRMIDIDFLAYGSLILESDRLTLPHPSCGERAFVLVPWNEIAPEWVHPILNLSIRQICERTVGRSDFLKVTKLL